MLGKVRRTRILRIPASSPRFYFVVLNLSVQLSNAGVAWLKCDLINRRRRRSTEDYGSGMPLGKHDQKEKRKTITFNHRSAHIGANIRKIDSMPPSASVPTTLCLRYQPAYTNILKQHKVIHFRDSPTLRNGTKLTRFCG